MRASGGGCGDKSGSWANVGGNEFVYRRKDKIRGKG